VSVAAGVRIVIQVVFRPLMNENQDSNVPRRVSEGLLVGVENSEKESWKRPLCPTKATLRYC